MIFYEFFFQGPPDPPRNCSLSNQTQDSLQVDCVEGFSSGLRQEFHMEVFALPEHHLLVNITARSPRLSARGLPSGKTLFLRWVHFTTSTTLQPITSMVSLNSGEVYVIRIVFLDQPSADFYFFGPMTDFLLLQLLVSGIQFAEFGLM